jgi:hypothetical protein
METNAIKTMIRGIVRCSYWILHVYSSTLGNFKVEVEAANSSATLMLSYQTARRHTPVPQLSDIPTLLGPMCTCGPLVLHGPLYMPVVGHVVKRQAGRGWERTAQERPIVFSVRNVHSDWMYRGQSEYSIGIKQPGRSEVSLAVARPSQVQLCTVTELSYQVSWSIR